MPYRTDNAADYELEDTYITEDNPPQPVDLNGNNRVIVAFEAPWGPYTPQEFSDKASFLDMYFPGGWHALSGVTLKEYAGFLFVDGKRWPKLTTVRVRAASGAAPAAYTFVNGQNNEITITAYYDGLGGNKLSVKIENGSTTGKKYTIKRVGDNGTFLKVLDNVTYSALPADDSANWVKFSVASGGLTDPGNIDYTPLTGGLDGTITSGDLYTSGNVNKGLGQCVGVGFNDAVCTTYACGTNSGITLECHIHLWNAELALFNADVQRGVCLGMAESGVLPSASTGHLWGTYSSAGGQLAAGSSLLVERIVTAYPNPKQYDSSYYGDNVVCPGTAAAACVLANVPAGKSPGGNVGKEFLTWITGLEIDLSRPQLVSCREHNAFTLCYDQDLKAFIVRSAMAGDGGLIYLRIFRDYCENAQSAVLALCRDLPVDEIRERGEVPLKAWLEGMKQAKPPIWPRINDYKLDFVSLNTPAQLALGNFRVFSAIENIPPGLRMILISQIGPDLGLSTTSTIEPA